MRVGGALKAGRHFAGEVIASDFNCVRLTGFVWVYNVQQARFVSRSEKRERILVLGDRLIINVLPPETSITDIIYDTDNTKKMFITDKKGFTLELSEFVSI